MSRWLCVLSTAVLCFGSACCSDGQGTDDGVDSASDLAVSGDVMDSGADVASPDTADDNNTQSDTSGDETPDAAVDLDWLSECGVSVAEALTLDEIGVLGRDTDDWRLPSQTQLVDFRAGFVALLMNQFVDADQRLESAGMFVCRGVESGDPVVVVAPLVAGQGKPVVAVRWDAERSIVLGAPHPL